MVGIYPITVIGQPLNKQTSFNLRIDPSPFFSVDCSASSERVVVGQNVTFTAEPDSVNLPVTTVWSGDVPNPAPTDNVFDHSYSRVGTKTAVANFTDGAGITDSCTVTLEVIIDPEFEEF